MAGERFGENTLDARIRDLDSRKHLRVDASYGRIYVRGYGDAYDVATYGRGGGFVSRETMEFRSLRRHIAQILESGGEAFTDYDLFPSDLR